MSNAIPFKTTLPNGHTPRIEIEAGDSVFIRYGDDLVRIRRDDLARIAEAKAAEAEAWSRIARDAERSQSIANGVLDYMGRNK